MVQLWSRAQTDAHRARSRRVKEGVSEKVHKSAEICDFCKNLMKITEIDQIQSRLGIFYEIIEKCRRRFGFDRFRENLHIFEGGTPRKTSESYRKSIFKEGSARKRRKMRGCRCTSSLRIDQ